MTVEIHANFMLTRVGDEDCDIIASYALSSAPAPAPTAWDARASAPVIIDTVIPAGTSVVAPGLRMLSPA